MEPSTIPYDPNQPAAADIDDTTGIEALRGAWSRRTDGFRALYLEHGAIGNETDARVATTLAAALRAPVTAPVVGHFRREIGMKAYERRVRPEETNGAAQAVAPNELPFDPSARSQAVSDEAYVAAAAVNALLSDTIWGEDAEQDARVAARTGQRAAAVARETVKALRGARS